MRAVPEWVGKTDDTPIPDRIKVRVFERAKGKCEKCTRKLYPGKWDVDHIVALANGGSNRERNLQALCCNPCHSGKTREDVKTKAVTYRKKKANIGLKRKSKWQTGKDSPWKKKLTGEVVRR